jgi:thioredoxin
VRSQRLILGRLLGALVRPCKAMAPVYERIASEFEPEIRFLKVDTEAEPELAARYDIRSIPTLMLFRKGAVVARQAGAMDARMLRSWLRRHTAYSRRQLRQASACPGKVGAGFPMRTCARSKNLERIPIRPNRDVL